MTASCILSSSPSHRLIYAELFNSVCTNLHVPVHANFLPLSKHSTTLLHLNGTLNTLNIKIQPSVS